MRWWSRRQGQLLLGGALALGAALRLWLAFHDDGVYWPDEIYQSLEPAHRLVFGYGLVAWEFIQGARNWALPGLVAGLLELSKAFGGSEPSAYLHVVRVAFCAIGVATAAGAYRLARAYGASALSAAVGASFFALGAPFIYFAPRAMSETASALPVVFGFALALRPTARRWELWLGASLLGLSVLLRLQNGVFCVGLLAILAARRDWRRAGEALGTLTVWAFAFGLLDKLTWGEWFHSAFVYLRFNFIEHGAEHWGTAEFPYYFRVWATSLEWVGILAAALALAAFPKARGLLLTALAFLLIHSLTPHKEFRFILPVMPLFAALAGIGLEWIRGRWEDASALTLAAALVAFGLWSAVRFHALTFGDIGQYEDAKPKASAYDDGGSVNRLLLAAHELPDLCGLKIETAHLAWTGGLSYLDRPVPLYMGPYPPRQSGYFNYVITARPWAGGAPIVATDGMMALVHILPDGCQTDVGYSWRLP